MKLKKPTPLYKKGDRVDMGHRMFGGLDWPYRAVGVVQRCEGIQVDYLGFTYTVLLDRHPGGEAYRMRPIFETEIKGRTTKIVKGPDRLELSAKRAWNKEASERASIPPPSLDEVAGWYGIGLEEKAMLDKLVDKTFGRPPRVKK